MKRYKIHICAFIFSITIFIFGNVVVDLYEKGQIEKKRSDLTSEGNLIANSISQYVNTALSLCQTISIVIAQSEDMNKIYDITDSILEKYKFNYIIEVAPKGVIRKVYPQTQKNNISIDKKVYEYQNNIKSEGDSVNIGDDLYLSSVVTLFSGGKGMIARSPVYKLENGKEEYWGFINCIVQEEELKKIISSKFNDKYKYKIYSINEDTGKKSYILENTKEKIKSPEEIYINFPNNKWILSIDKNDILGNTTFFIIARIIIFIIASGGYALLYTLLKYSSALKEQVIEIREANAKAKKSEEKYRRFFNMSPDYIFIMDSKTNSVIEANETFTNSTEISQVNRCFEKLSLTCCDFKGQRISIPTKNGDVIEMEVNSTSLDECDLNNRILCVGRDLIEKIKFEKIEKEKIEKEEQLKEALEYDKIKTEFFANMSHELRTPLNVILGSLQLINLNLKKHGDVREYVEKNNQIIKQNCYRLLRIISNIIDITKFESNYLHIQLKKLNIVALIEDITLSVVEYAKGKNIHVEFDTDIEEEYIKCDPEKIERIILNLLSNAIKFTKSGNHIYVNIYDLDDKIRICVKDTGIGIPKESLESIFERFSQVNKSFIREHEGSGIGLSLVKSLVEMHGGIIWAQSDYGKGSEFYIDLPKNYFEVFAEDECAADLLAKTQDNLVEKISIEFSDIYFS